MVMLEGVYEYKSHPYQSNRRTGRVSTGVKLRHNELRELRDGGGWAHVPCYKYSYSVKIIQRGHDEV